MDATQKAARFTIDGQLDTPAKLVRRQQHRNARQNVCDVMYALNGVGCQKRLHQAGIRLIAMSEDRDGNLFDMIAVVPLVEITYQGGFTAPAYLGDIGHEEIMLADWTDLLGDDRDDVAEDMALFATATVHGSNLRVKLYITSTILVPSIMNADE